MRNIKLTIEYDGSAYCGWQVQANGITVQETIEKALGEVLGERVRIFGSGRTDAGVHALGQTAHFRTENPLPVRDIRGALNDRLPEDIAVLDVEEVPIDFHARKSATAKTYRYVVLNRRIPSPLERKRSLWVSSPLDVEKMNLAAVDLVGKHDFSSFGSNSGRENDNPVRTIRSLTIEKEGDRFVFEVTGDGFLYKMVRGIVGTLLDVGRGKRSLESVREILEARDRRRGGPNVSPHGLYLVCVEYGEKGA